MQAIIDYKPKNKYYCGFFKNGYCPYGDKCWSIHELAPKKFFPTIPCKYVLEGKLCPRRKDCWFNHTIPNNYKTIVCRHFEKNGWCPEGNTCTYKHN